MKRTFDKCFPLREKSGSAVHDYRIDILLAMLFKRGRTFPFWQRRNVKNPYIAYGGNRLCMPLHEVADGCMRLAGIPARGEQYGKLFLAHANSRLQSKLKRLHDFLVGSERKIHLICSRF